MPSSASPAGIYDLGVTLLGCALTAVEATPGGGGKISRSCVVWGDIALDKCECGELYVAIGRQAPSASFPQEGSFGPITKCGPPIWMVTYLIQVARCSPWGEGQEPPSCSALQDAARIAAIDAWSVRNGVSCCLVSLQRDLTENGATPITNFLIREQITYGPEGGCAGSVLNVLVGLRHCQCADEGS